MQDLFPHPWLVNTLLDKGYIAHKREELGKAALPYSLGTWLEQHFNVAELSIRSEAQLEERFIGPLLKQLGWISVTQETLTVQGKLAKPDWCLLLHPSQDHALVTNKDHQLITAICESKAWGKTLDTGKADRTHNPHHQLQDYLSTLRVRFGFLTNGRVWRIYDTDKVTAKKTYVQFDLEAICTLPEGRERAEALALFAFFFGRNTYVPPTTAGATLAVAAAGASSHAASSGRCKRTGQGPDGSENPGQRLRQRPFSGGSPAHPDYARLTQNALLLSLAASWDDFAELVPLFNVQPGDVPKACDQLRAENDRTVARLYGMTDAELAHLLRSFKGLAAKRPEYLALLQ